MRAPPIIPCVLLLASLCRAEAARQGVEAETTSPRNLAVSLHLALGAASLARSATQPGLVLSLTGAAVPAAVSVGVAIGGAWTVAAGVWGAASPDPWGLVRGVPLASSGCGLQLVLRPRPLDLFVAFSPSATVLSIRDDRGTFVARTGLGLGAKLAAGKEWRVGSRWTLALAVEALVTDRDPRNSAAAAFGSGLAFSVTYD